MVGANQSRLLIAILGAILYFAYGKIALIVTQGFAAMVWPAAGVALALLCLFGRNLWPFIALASFLVNVTSGVPLLACLPIAFGAALSAYLGAFFLTTAPEYSPKLDKLNVVYRLIIPVAISCTGLSALIGTLSLTFSGVIHITDFWMSLRAWWVGDAIGNLIVAPFLLLALSKGKFPKIERAQIFEGACLGVALVAANLFVFDDAFRPIKESNPGSYLVFPIVFWAALRFGMLGTTLASFLVATVTMIDLYRSTGTVLFDSSNENLFYLQILQSILAASGLIFAAIVAEKQQIAQALLASHDNLENKVRLRTKELRNSDQRFRLFAESLKDYALFMLDPRGHITTWNAGAHRMKGYTASEIIGQHFSKFYTGADKAAGKPAYELRVARSEGHVEDEGFRVRKDGSAFWANVVITAIYDEKGELLGFAKITRDLTERKRVDDELRAARDELEKRVEERTKELAASRDQLRVIFKGINDGISVVDETGKFIFANDAAAKICGFDSTEALMKLTIPTLNTHLQIRNEEGRLLKPGETPFWKAVDGSESTGVVMRIRLSSTGEDRWIMVNASPIADDGPRAKMIVIIFKDFTERKRMEDTLKYLDEANRVLTASLRVEETLTRLADLAIDGLGDWCSIDLLDRERDRLNSIAVRHKDQRKLALGVHLRKKFDLNDNRWSPTRDVVRTGKALLVEQVTTALLSRMAQSNEHLQIMQDLGFCSGIIVPLQSRDRVLGTISIFSAESGRRYTQQDLSLAEELGRRAGIAIDNALLYGEAQKAIQMRDEFLSVASHELKTPMTSLKLQAQIRKRTMQKRSSARGLDFERMIQLAEDDEHQVDRLTRLVDEMLDMSRLQAGRLKLDIQEFDFAKSVRDILNAYEPQIQSSECDVSFVSDEQIIGAWDPMRMEQLFTNLLTNALKYGRGKPAHIKLERHDGRVRLTVEDHGIGIAAEDQKRIFRQFERAENVQGISGLGLGLYICKQIVDAHGGSIQVSSQESRGSKFVVDLPVNARDFQGGLH